MPREETIRCDRVRGRRGSTAPFVAAPSLGQDGIHDRTVDSFERELAAQRDLPPRPCSIPGLDPAPSEGLVVEDAQVKQADDGVLDQFRTVTGVGEAVPNLVDGPRPRFEEPRGGIQHDLRVVDCASARPSLGQTLTAAGDWLVS
jgi:hypothetical protein